MTRPAEIRRYAVSLHSRTVCALEFLDVNYHIGSRAGAAEEHLARIRRIQRFEEIVDFAFHKLVLARVTNTGAATKVRKDSLIFGKIE